MKNRIEYKYILALLFLLQGTFLFSQHPLFEHHPPPEKNTQIHALVAGNNNHLHISSQHGVYRYNGFQYEKIALPSGASESYTGLYFDSDNMLWSYSSEGNLYFLKDGKFKRLEISSGLKETFSNRIINCLYIDKKNLWVSTVIGGGTYKIVLGNPEISVARSGDRSSFFIKEIEENGFVWGANNVMPANNKLRVELLEKEPFTIQLSDGTGYSKTSFLQLEDHTFLFAREHEIIHLNDSGVLGRAFVEKKVEKLCQDKEGKIWVGLYTGGLICYPTGTLASGSMINYLGGKTVTGIDEDHSGNLWISTLKDGLYRLQSEPDISYSPPQIYSSTNKDTVEEINDPITSESHSGVKAEKDKRFISTVGKRKTSPPVVFINNININNEDTVVRDSYKLPHYKNFITVFYSGLVNYAPEKLQYKYKLEGVDEKWIYTSATAVQYTTLPHGKYEFVVYAMNDDGIWSEDPARVSFTIRPPFWRTWWFYLSAGTLFLFIVILIIILGIRQARKKERQKAEINKRILNSELEALRSQMNPHFIFNTLSSIQHYIMDKDSETASDYLSKFARLIRLIMENTKKPKIPIKDEIEALELYLQLESLRLDHKFEYRINLDSNIDPQYDEIPSLLIQPYVENAIWHGISHKKGKGLIGIEIEREDQHIICTITDNGIGRGRSRTINAKKKKHKSRGMSITKERLDILNAYENSDLNVKITDLKNKEGQAAGTKVEIFVPL